MPRLGDASATLYVPRVGLGSPFVFRCHLVPVSSQCCVTLEHKVLLAEGVMGDALSAPREPGACGALAEHPCSCLERLAKEGCQTARRLRRRQQSACTSALSLCLLVTIGALLTTTNLRVWESQKGRRDTGWEGAFLSHNIWDQTQVVINTSTSGGQAECLPSARRFLGELMN